MNARWKSRRLRRAVVTLGALIAATSACSDGDATAPGAPDDAAPPAAVAPASELPALPLLPSTELSVGAPVTTLRAGGGYLWGVAGPATLVRIDTRRRVAEHVDLGLTPSSNGPPLFAFAAGAIWAIGTGNRTLLLRVDPDTLMTTLSLELPTDHSIGTVTPSDSVWVQWLDHTSQLDATTGATQRDIALPGDPGSTEPLEDRVYVSMPDIGSVSRLDPETGELLWTIATGAGAGPMAVGSGALWVANTAAGSVSRLALDTGVIDATIDVEAARGDGLAERVVGTCAGAGAIWVVSDGPSGAVLHRIDPVTNAVDAQRRFGDFAGQVFVGDALWVSRPSANSVVRVDVAHFADGTATPAAHLLPTTDAQTSTPTSTRFSDDERAVAAVFQAFATFGEPLEARRALIDHPEVIGTTLEQIDEVAGPAGSIAVRAVSIVGEEAAVTFDYLSQGLVSIEGLELGLHHRQNTWVVTAESWCALVATLDQPCPPKL